MKKYELTDESIKVGERTLYRIKALKDFENVEKGELGGFVEGEDNLSHENNAWVYGDAWVSGDARVYGNARVSGDARVYGNARVSGDAWVSGNADIANNKNFFVAQNVGTEYGVLTVFKCKDGVIKCTRGCFFGTTEEFLKKSKDYHDEKIHNEYKLLIEVGLSIISRSEG